MNSRPTIGIDLGGTFIKGGLCNSEGKLLTSTSTATEAEGGFEHVVSRMAGLITELLKLGQLKRGDVAAIGIGSPGPLSRSAGIIYFAPNLPGWKNVPVRDRLADLTEIPVVLENDANAAAFGEFVSGAGARVHSMIMLTLGTGVGGGIVLDNQLWRGVDDAGAEVGHMVIAPHGRACPCGQAGCLERYASASAVAQRAIEAMKSGEESALSEVIRAGKPIDAKSVANAARNGDALAARIWDETCMYLALGCVNLEHLLAPEMIVLAGGLIQAGNQLLFPMRAHFTRLRWKIQTTPPRIEFATLGTDAGIIGAAMLARQSG